jgi:hypothetical protein
MKGHKYTIEEEQFLIDSAAHYNYSELTKLFNQKFGTDVSETGIQQRCSKVLKTRAKSLHHHYSDEEKQFLSDNIEGHTYQELTDLFNLRFGTNVPSHSISDVCTKRMKVKRNCNTGQFKQNEERPCTKQIGQEVWRCGYIYVKVADVYHEGKTNYKQLVENWQPKHRYIYEQAHGKIKKDEIVVFLDGDNTNFDINNLYCMNRRINLIMNKHKWFTADRELTLTAIKLCELICALKDQE